MSIQKTIQVICLIGTVLLLGVIYGIVSENFSDSIPSIPSRDFGETPSDAPSSSRALHPAPLEISFPQNDSHPVSESDTPPYKKNVHFISKDGYDQLISALFLLFMAASGENPTSGADGRDAISTLPDEEGVPETLADERLGIRLYYNELLKEKRRWDRHRQERYKSILESWVEPATIESDNLELENEENMEYFLELEASLALHKRLLRDVRIFHDEVKFQKEQSRERQPYQPYESKSKLSPFAREAALSDAMQQAMSSLSAGMYHREASEVMKRLCDEFVSPVRMLDEPSAHSDDTSLPYKYNYNTYIVFAKKLMNYSDALLRQSSVELASSSRGELDFINRRLSESLNNLYEIGQNKTIRADYLDLEELERDLQSM